MTLVSYKRGKTELPPYLEALHDGKRRCSRGCGDCYVSCKCAERHALRLRSLHPARLPAHNCLLKLHFIWSQGKASFPNRICRILMTVSTPLMRLAIDRFFGSIILTTFTALFPVISRGPSLLSCAYIALVVWRRLSSDWGTQQSISLPLFTRGRKQMQLSERCFQRKIWGFHGGGYEECRLLGYINPVRTSQETHYLSATQSSRLMLWKIWGFLGGDYEECCLLGYKTQFVPHRRHITSPLHSPAD
jgi:hypothetical protein